jgi:hypothetical protein
MAGDDDRNRVATVGRADRASSLPWLDPRLEERRIDASRELAIADRAPIRDREQRTGRDAVRIDRLVAAIA